MAALTIFWFRRDLRLEDNVGLYHALTERSQVQPIFIFDTDILSALKDPTDARVTFIHQTVIHLQKQLQQQDADLWVFLGKPLEVLQSLSEEHHLEAIYTNNDYEPLARKRDQEVFKWAQEKGIGFFSFKDQCLFEKSEILTGTNKPYTVFTAYKNKVLAALGEKPIRTFSSEKKSENYRREAKPRAVPSLQELGFQKSHLSFPSAEVSLETLKKYEKLRDFPAEEGGTTQLGLHLRFGTVSVRKMAQLGLKHSPVWLSELIWRDFFMQILWHFPQVMRKSFRPEYDQIDWRKSKTDFQKWCEGKTGYPLVDAGMRELNATGYMHNRVRMVAASFLCKHLLIHWYHGERYFAEKLLDYDLAANNGNWQWVAGSGCDAAPYFRIFNPILQTKRFDPDGEYIKKWVPEYGTPDYVEPLVDHEYARRRCLAAYSEALGKDSGQML